MALAALSHGLLTYSPHSKPWCLCFHQDLNLTRFRSNIIIFRSYFVYYESIKRELKIKPISECRCDERLKTKAEESTRLADIGLLRELEHLKNLKIKTRLIDEKFASVMGECVI